MDLEPNQEKKIIDTKEEWEDAEELDQVFVGPYEDLRLNTKKEIDEDEDEVLDINKNDLIGEGDFHHIGFKAKKDFKADIELEHVRERGLNKTCELIIYDSNPELREIYREEYEYNTSEFFIEDITFQKDNVYYIGHTKGQHLTDDVERPEGEFIDILSSHKNKDSFGEDLENYTASFSKIILYPTVTKDIDEGVRTDTPVDISDYSIMSEAVLSWDSMEGYNTNIDLEVSPDSDNWYKTYNGEKIPFLTTGTNVNSDELYIRQILQSNDVTRSPLLFSVELLLKSSTCKIQKSNTKTLQGLNWENVRFGDISKVSSNALVPDIIEGGFSSVEPTKINTEINEIRPNPSDINIYPITARRGFLDWTIDDIYNDTSITVNTVSEVQYTPQNLILSFKTSEERVNNVLKPIEKRAGEANKHILSNGKIIGEDDAGGKNEYIIIPPDDLNPPFSRRKYVANSYEEEPLNKDYGIFKVDIELIPTDIEELERNSFSYERRSPRDWRIDTYFGVLYTSSIGASVETELENDITIYELTMILNDEKAGYFLDSAIYTNASTIDKFEDGISIPVDGSNGRNTLFIKPPSDNYVLDEGEYILLEWELNINNEELFTITINICEKV